MKPKPYVPSMTPEQLHTLKCQEIASWMFESVGADKSLNIFNPLTTETKYIRTDGTIRP